ncbi:hypothetical protein L7F22_010519 [Adiantum nelumboides]|nr:hypothetical protein [Adiantum nelumboides]
MAIKTLQTIVARARGTSSSAWPPSGHVVESDLNQDFDSPPDADAIIRVVILNRLGPVLVGESSILIGVACPHRHRAFQVAEWLLEETKRTVPIWKKEIRRAVKEHAANDDHAPSRWMPAEPS